MSKNIYEVLVTERYITEIPVYVEADNGAQALELAQSTINILSLQDLNDMDIVPLSSVESEKFVDTKCKFIKEVEKIPSGYKPIVEEDVNNLY